MILSKNFDGDLMIIGLSGDLTFFNVAQVIAEIDNARSLHRTTRVAIDTLQVPTIDSAAFGALVSKSRELMAAGGYLRLINPHPGIVNASYRIHIETILPSYNSLEEAIRT